MHSHSRPGIALLACATLLALAACTHDTGETVAAMDLAATGLKGGGGGNNGGGGGTAPTLVAEPNVRSMRLNWNDDGTSQYNVYVSSSPDCDIVNYSLCPDGQMVAGARAPYSVDGLDNGRVYYAKVEKVEKAASGRKSTQSLVSNLAGARPTTLEFGGDVWTIAAAPDGTKYIGGDFTRVGLTSGQGAVLDPSTGKQSVPGFPYIGEGDVLAAAPDGMGGWYVGGNFLRIGNVDRPYLAHLRSDGSLDTAWNPQPSGPVRAMAAMNGVLYVAGGFSTINGQARHGLAAVAAPTGQLMAWNPDPNFAPVTLAAANGTVYIGGTFTKVGAFWRDRLAAVDVNGNVLPWDPGADDTVMVITVAGSTVYVGGHFSTVGGQPRNKLVAVDATTGQPRAWNASLDCLGCEVRALAVSGSTLYVGGRFPSIKGVARKHIAALDAATGNVLPWNPNAEYAVHSIAVIRDSTRTTVYAGGEFTAIGGQPHAYLAAIDAQGAAVPAWHPAPTAAVGLVTAAGGQVLVGGRFTGLNAVVRNGLAAVDASGALKAWNPNAVGTVFALAAAGNSVYVGGWFRSVGGQPRAHIARVDATTGLVDGWNPGTDYPVLALAVGSSGTVYAGGEFRHVAGTPRNRLAAFAPSGTMLGWAPNADHDVRALAVGPWLQSGESVYVGGRFGAINGQVRRRIAHIDAHGFPTAWNPWGTGSVTAHEAVHALAYADGHVYAGGIFAGMGGYNLAQVTETGVPVPIQNANFQVWSLAVAGNRLTLGGDFSTVWAQNGVVTPRSHVATIDLATRTVTPWNPSIVFGTVYAIAAEGSTLHLGGTFRQIDGQVVSGFATLTP